MLGGFSSPDNEAGCFVQVLASVLFSAEFLCSGCSWLSSPRDVTRVGCGCCGDCSTPGQSLICHTSSPASALPPLSAQISSNGRGACRTFLRSDGVTEAETQDPPMAPDPLPPFCQRTQSSTLGRRAEAGQALTVTGAAWPGCTQLHPSRGSVGEGVSVMQSWCGHREAVREEAEGGRSPKNAPQSWPPHGNWTGGAWARGGPTWSFPTPPYFLLHPSLKSRGAHLPGHRGSQEINLPQCRSLPSHGEWLLGERQREEECGSVGRCPLPSQDQKRGPGTGRGGIWVLLAPLRSRSGRRLAPGPASCRC